MFIDSRTLPDGTAITADICIIGGGVAGITIAREFIGKPIKVALLESGGFVAESDTQALYAGENVGVSYAPETTRSRFLGGSSNCWVGWCRPLDPLDFQHRPWVPNSGWPIGHAQLGDYYQRSHAVLQLDGLRFDPESWRERLAGLGLDFLPLRNGGIRNQVGLFSPPTRFGEAYRDQLQSADNIHVYLYANVTELASDGAATLVRHVDAATLQGNRFTVAAKAFVLATGGIENARLLLLSNRTQSAGLGNGYDLVGRYFMEHPRLRGRKIRLRDPRRHRRLYDSTLVMSRRRLNTRSLRLGLDLAPTEKTLREQELQNSRTYLTAIYRGDGSREIEALRRGYQMIKNRSKYGYGPMNLARHLGPNLPAFVARLPQLVAAVFDHATNTNHAGREFWLDTVIEPAPNPDSRITLSEERDSLGLNRSRVDLRLTDADRETFRRTQRLLCAELEATGAVQAEALSSASEPRWPDEVFWCAHHMGTTRMHEDPRSGVVNADCRVHGIGNLYVAGSSVFPTVGSDIPTMTIVALALRLADHLWQEVAGGGKIPDLPGAAHA